LVKDADNLFGNMSSTSRTTPNNQKARARQAELRKQDEKRFASQLVEQDKSKYNSWLSMADSHEASRTFQNHIQVSSMNGVSLSTKTTMRSVQAPCHAPHVMRFHVTSAHERRSRMRTVVTCTDCHESSTLHAHTNVSLAACILGCIWHC
jgi:hypothetical protein